MHSSQNDSQLIPDVLNNHECEPEAPQKLHQVCSRNRLGISWKIAFLLRDVEGPRIPLGELPKRSPWRLAAAALAIPVNKPVAV